MKAQTNNRVITISEVITTRKEGKNEMIHSHLQFNLDTTREVHDV